MFLLKVDAWSELSCYIVSNCGPYRMTFVYSILCFAFSDFHLHLIKCAENGLLKIQMSIKRKPNINTKVLKLKVLLTLDNAEKVIHIELLSSIIYVSKM